MQIWPTSIHILNTLTPTMISSNNRIPILTFMYRPNQWWRGWGNQGFLCKHSWCRAKLSGWSDRRQASRGGTTDIICLSCPWYKQHQPPGLAVCVISALHRAGHHIWKCAFSAWLTEHILCFAAPLFHPGACAAQGVGLTLSTSVPWQVAVGWTCADAVLGGCAGRFLNKACRTQRLAAMALLDTVLAPCKGLLRAGAALPHGRWRAVDRDIGACGTFVTDQLGARVSVHVLIVTRRKGGLVICAGCGQNPSWDVSKDCT